MPARSESCAVRVSDPLVICDGGMGGLVVYFTRKFR